jgi:hypothetical protein
LFCVFLYSRQKLSGLMFDGHKNLNYRRTNGIMNGAGRAGGRTLGDGMEKIENRFTRRYTSCRWNDYIAPGTSRVEIVLSRSMTMMNDTPNLSRCLHVLY